MAYKVQHPWNFELTDEEKEQQLIQQQLAQDYEHKTPWDHENNQTIDEITENFDKKITGCDYNLVQPWDMTDSTILDQQNKIIFAQTYQYVPFWRPQKITPKQRALLKTYSAHLTCPYRREDNFKPETKINSIRCDPSRNMKTLPPWEYGNQAPDPINFKAEPRPPTSLWDKPPEVKKVYPFEPSGDPVLDNLRVKLFEHGATGMLSLSRKFRIMDDDNNGTLDYDEFRKGMKECNIADLSEKAIKHLFHYFDKDDSGSITLDEFMFAIRGALNARRKALVDQAFKVLDSDGSGVIDYNDVKDVYNTSSHPDYISGKKTKEEILNEFLSNFELKSSKSKFDGNITYEEFFNYYCSISASIDDDDYFELMIRNAWHISGGSGWSANTANKRVLVTHSDGSQTVEEIKSDLGMGKDSNDILERLQRQGLKDVTVSGFVNKLRKETKAVESNSLESFLLNNNQPNQSNNSKTTPLSNRNSNNIKKAGKALSLSDHVDIDALTNQKNISTTIPSLRANSNIQGTGKPAALFDLLNGTNKKNNSNNGTNNNTKVGPKSLLDHLT